MKFFIFFFFFLSAILQATSTNCNNPDSLTFATLDTGSVSKKKTGYYLIEVDLDGNLDISVTSITYPITLSLLDECGGAPVDSLTIYGDSSTPINVNYSNLPSHAYIIEITNPSSTDAVDFNIQADLSVDSAPDLCYNEFTTECVCTSSLLGLCLAGECTSTFPVNDSGNENLEDTKIYLVESSLIALNFDDCSVDSGTKNSNCSIGNSGFELLELLSLFGAQGVVFDLGNNFTSLDQNHTVEIYEGGLLTGLLDSLSDLLNSLLGVLTSTNVYGSYTKNGATYVGELGECTGGGGGVDLSEETGNGDLIDTPITTSTQVSQYNASIDTGSATGSPASSSLKFLRTKITGETTSMTAVYLDENGISKDFDNHGQSNDGAIWMLIPLLNDLSTTGGCPAANPDQLQPIIDVSTGLPAIFVVNDNGSSDFSDTRNVILPTTASVNATIEFISIDLSRLNVDAQDCVAVSSTTGNLQGLGQCVNSKIHYVDAYGLTAWDRCVDLPVHGQPCLSSNGGVGTGLFANDLGCLMCTFYAGTGCSSDDFALRPDHFTLSSTAAHMPDLLRSGQEYNLTINAYNIDGVTNTQGYNQIKNNLDLNTSTVFTKDGSATTMFGTVSWALSDFNITNGISTYGGSSEVAALEFDDVGRVEIEVSDQNWAAIDTDDTPADCDNIWICGDKNVTFIPHHFAFADSNLSNYTESNTTAGDFTYLANITQTDSNMSARIKTTIVVQNEANGTTRNFSSGAAFYEHNLSVSMSATHPLYGDANTTAIPISLLGFTQGESNITWADTDLNRVLRFNFPRDVNNSINPFDMNISNIDLLAEANYTQPAVVGYDSTASIDGNKTGLDDGNATFYYGRTLAPKVTILCQSLPCRTGVHSSNVYDTKSLLYFSVYCNPNNPLNGAQCQPNLLLPSDSTQTNDIRWWTNNWHLSNSFGETGDVSEVSGSGTITMVNNPPANTSRTYVKESIIESSSTPYDALMQMQSSHWLIYDENNNSADTNKFTVEFIGESDWSGKYEEDSTTKTKIAPPTNRRIQW